MLKSLEIQNLDKIIIEVILVDGKSSDKSCKVISDFISNSLNKNVHYKILPNEKRKTSYGFNLGIKYANANIIGFGGAHCIYPDDLFKNVIDIFKNIDADVIGGGHKNMIPDKKRDEFRKLTYANQDNYQGVSEFKRILNYFISYEH